MAATTQAIDTAVRVFVGMRPSDAALSPEEGAALVALLKVEGGVLLGLFFLLTPRGRRKPGETNTCLNRG